MVIGDGKKACWITLWIDESLVLLWILIGHKMYHFLKLFSVRYLSPYLLGKYVIPSLILFYLIFYNVDCRVLRCIIWLYNIIFLVYFCQFVHIHNFLRTALKWLIYYLKFIIRSDVRYWFLYYLIAILATFLVTFEICNRFIKEKDELKCW